MSGGSWDYVFSKFDDVADQLSRSKRADRRALGKLVFKVSKAMHDIEWVDSCDYGPDGDVEAIADVLGRNAASLVLEETVEQAKVVCEELKRAIARAEETAVCVKE